MPGVDAGVVQLLIAGVGVGGTLFGVVVTRIFDSRAERRRLESEDRRRWLADRFRVDKELVTLALRAERRIWDLAAFLPDDAAKTDTMRGLGHTSIVSVPDEGIQDVIDQLDLEILREGDQEVLDLLRRMDETVAELGILEDEESLALAEHLLDSLYTAAGQIEAFRINHDAWDAVLAAREARLAFQRQARTVLTRPARNETRLRPMSVAEANDATVTPSRPVHDINHGQVGIDDDEPRSITPMA